MATGKRTIAQGRGWLAAKVRPLGWQNAPRMWAKCAKDGGLNVPRMRAKCAMDGCGEMRRGCMWRNAPWMFVAKCAVDGCGEMRRG